MDEIEQIATKLVYKNRWMSVREDQIRRQDGSLGTYGVVEKPDFAIIEACARQSSGAGRADPLSVSNRFWELPQGTWDTERDDPIAPAAAELKEETGIVARSMIHVVHLYLAYGFCTQGYNVFLAACCDHRYG
jgi:8-oxo-dGTP pyrophosphatase MutT (NUDIX family)